MHSTHHKCHTARQCLQRVLSSPSEDNPYEARPCPVCHKLISNRANLKKHLKIRHSVQEEALCLYCRKVFRNKYSLWTHINSYHPGVKNASNQDIAAAQDAGGSVSGVSGVPGHPSSYKGQ